MYVSRGARARVRRVRTVPVPQTTLFSLFDSADLCLFFFGFDAEFLFT